MSRFSLEGYEGNAFDINQCIHEAKNSADPATLTALFNHWDDDVMHELALNVKTPVEILNKFALLGNLMLVKVMMNPSFNLADVVFSNGTPVPARMLIAKNIRTPRYVLEDLWKNDPDRFVREEARINLGIGFVRR